MVEFSSHFCLVIVNISCGGGFSFMISCGMKEVLNLGERLLYCESISERMPAYIKAIRIMLLGERVFCNYSNVLTLDYPQLNSIQAKIMTL